MIDKKQQYLPGLFEKLAENQYLSKSQIYGTSDGFWVAVAAMADILACRGITTVPGCGGVPLECRLFFDDWYLYAVRTGNGYTYSLVKMREQEFDAKLGRCADGDTPGVTISFIALETDIL